LLTAADQVLAAGSAIELSLANVAFAGGGVRMIAVQAHRDTGILTAGLAVGTLNGRALASVAGFAGRALVSATTAVELVPLSLDALPVAFCRFVGTLTFTVDTLFVRPAGVTAGSTVVEVG